MVLTLKDLLVNFDYRVTRPLGDLLLLILGLGVTTTQQKATSYPSPPYLVEVMVGGVVGREDPREERLVRVADALRAALRRRRREGQVRRRPVPLQPVRGLGRRALPVVFQQIT